MINRQNKIVLNQSLHGYSEGHRLLQKSFEIPEKYKRTILILSDLSGSNIVDGFEEYITGYPLYNSQIYALAKTWYAYEMERPGCVWTHTLFIHYSDFAKISNFKIFLQFFKRPKNNLENEYENEIIVEERDYISNRNTNNRANSFEYKNEALKKTILSHLYSYSSIIIPLNSNKLYEDFILEIWNQQWPNLRVEFCFCTGSLSDRKLNNKLFDLQIIPEYKINLFKKNNEQRGIANKTNLNINHESWVQTAFKDLYSPGQLRKFLWTYGNDIEKKKAAFVQLIDLYTSIRNNDINDAFLDKIALSFPAKNEAIELKNEFFGNQQKNSIRQKEDQILKYLCTTKHDDAFDVDLLKIDKRTEKFWLNNRNRAIGLTKLLLQKRINSLGISYLTGVSNVINISDLKSITKSNPKKIMVFIKLNPSLASSNDIWQGSIDYKRELLESIISLKKISSKNWTKIITILIKNNVDEIVDELILALGSKVFKIILDLLTTKKILNQELSYIWKKRLTENQEYILAWLEKKKPIGILELSTISDILRPDLGEFRESKNLDSWFSIDEKLLIKMNSPDRIKLLSFLFSLGLGNNSNKSAKLISISFEPIHDFLSNSTLQYDLWKRIEYYLPTLSFWYDWDKCEQMRRGLLEYFSENDWPTKDFIKSVNNPDTLKLVLNYGKSRLKYKEYINKLKDDLKTQKYDIDNENLAVLNNL